MRVLVLALALAAAGCSSMQGEMTWVAQSPLIDQPTGGRPYNSLICP